MRNSKFNELFKLVMESAGIEFPERIRKNIIYDNNSVWITSEISNNPFFRKSSDTGNILILKNLYNIAHQIYLNNNTYSKTRICPGCIIQLYYAIQNNDIETIKNILGHGMSKTGLCDKQTDNNRPLSRIPGFRAKGYLDRTYCTQMWHDVLKQVKIDDIKLSEDLLDILDGKNNNREQLLQYNNLCIQIRKEAVALFKSNLSADTNITMEWTDIDPTYLSGRAAYGANEISADNDLIPVLNPETGEQMLNIYGNPIYWEVMAPEYDAYDMLTGQKIPANAAICLTYTINPNRRCTFKGAKATRKYVLQSTYEDAYANNDTEMIGKLQAIGLKPGIKF